MDGSKTQTYIALENFIQKYPSGKRATVSSSSVILIDSSSYFIKNNLNILSISIAASSSIIKTIPNVLSYKYLNQSAVVSNFIVYQDYQMNKHIYHILILHSKHHFPKHLRKHLKYRL